MANEAEALTLRARLGFETGKAWETALLVEGEFVWHSHPDTDDFILVLAGRLTVETRDEALELGPGELVVVPKGVEHRTRAESGAHILLVEPRGTPNTGDADAEPAAEVEI